MKTNTSTAPANTAGLPSAAPVGETPAPVAQAAPVISQTVTVLELDQLRRENEALRDRNQELEGALKARQPDEPLVAEKMAAGLSREHAELAVAQQKLHDAHQAKTEAARAKK